MSNSTILNILAGKVTQLNSQASVHANPVDHTIAEKYLVTSRMNTLSGEADLYNCLEVGTNKTFVLKLYRRKDALKPEILDILLELEHPNVSKIVAAGIFEDFPYVIIPLYKNGTLQQIIETGNRLSVEDLRQTVIPSLINGINELHCKGILHKDLKPANIMIDDEGNLVIIDFGISTATNGQTVVITQTGMTTTYLAPEAFQNTYTKETDYYALGIMLYELFTGHNPYQNLTKEQAASFASVQKIVFTEDFPADLRDLITGLTYKDISNRNDKSNPNRRWCFEEVSNWLNGVKQPIPGIELNGDNSYKQMIPYKFQGRFLKTNRELIETLLINWRDGLKELGRGILTRHYDLNNASEATFLCEEAEKQLSNDPSQAVICTHNPGHIDY